MEGNHPKSISAEELDAKHEAGEDLSEHMDWKSGTKGVIVRFPIWMVDGLDAEAKRLGITRQSVIKFMIDEQLRLRALAIGEARRIGDEPAIERAEKRKPQRKSKAPMKHRRSTARR